MEVILKASLTESKMLFFSSKRKNLTIEKGINTPEVNFDSKKGILSLTGISIPEDVKTFYDPLIAWIEDYFRSPCRKTILNVHLEYLNTASSMYLVRLFRTLETLSDKKHAVEINWIYDSTDMDILEEGRDFQSLVSIPIRMVEAKN
ncbi:MAG: DUF1987 domain-containing protein [Bacteroidetes bacterium]|nr:DUF1987 domain-containing protein [Bacteroidota bacterium]